MENWKIKFFTRLLSVLQGWFLWHCWHTGDILQRSRLRLSLALTLTLSDHLTSLRTPDVPPMSLRSPRRPSGYWPPALGSPQPRLSHSHSEPGSASQRPPPGSGTRPPVSLCLPHPGISRDICDPDHQVTLSPLSQMSAPAHYQWTQHYTSSPLTPSWHPIMAHLDSEPRSVEPGSATGYSSQGASPATRHTREGGAGLAPHQCLDSTNN